MGVRGGFSALKGDLSNDLRGGLSDTVNLGGGLSDTLDLRGGISCLSDDVFLLHSGEDLSNDLVHLSESLSDLGGGLSNAVFLPH